MKTDLMDRRGSEPAQLSSYVLKPGRRQCAFCGGMVKLNRSGCFAKHSLEPEWGVQLITSSVADCNLDTREKLSTSGRVVCPGAGHRPGEVSALAVAFSEAVGMALDNAIRSFSVTSVSPKTWWRAALANLLS